VKKDENVTKETENTEIEKPAVEQPQKPGSFHFVSGTGKKLAADNALLTEVMKERQREAGKRQLVKANKMILAGIQRTLSRFVHRSIVREAKHQDLVKTGYLKCGITVPKRNVNSFLKEDLLEMVHDLGARLAEDRGPMQGATVASALPDAGQPPATEGNATEGDQAPATEGTAAEGDQAPATEGTATKGDQAPATHGKSTEGDQAPATEGTATEGDQAPATEGNATKGDQVPATEGTAAEGDQANAAQTMQKWIIKLPPKALETFLWKHPMLLASVPREITEVKDPGVTPETETLPTETPEAQTEAASGRRGAKAKEPKEPKEPKVPKKKESLEPQKAKDMKMGAGSKSKQESDIPVFKDSHGIPLDLVRAGRVLAPFGLSDQAVLVHPPPSQALPVLKGLRVVSTWPELSKKLQKTSLGRTVNGLRHHQDANVAQVARELVNCWREECRKQRKEEKDKKEAIAEGRPTPVLQDATKPKQKGRGRPSKTEAAELEDLQRTEAAKKPRGETDGKAASATAEHTKSAEDSD